MVEIKIPKFISFDSEFQNMNYIGLYPDSPMTIAVRFYSVTISPSDPSYSFEVNAFCDTVFLRTYSKTTFCIIKDE